MLFWSLHKTQIMPLSPDGASGWRQWAHEVGDVVWNVDGQWGNLGLDGLDRWFRHVPWLLLVIGQGCERDLYTSAGEPETTPEDDGRACVKYRYNSIKISVCIWVPVSKWETRNPVHTSLPPGDKQLKEV